MYNIILFTSIITLTLLPALAASVGVLDFGDVCDISKIYSLDESRKCDSLRGLYCNGDRGECRCFIPGLYYQKDKCRAKVRKTCGRTQDGYYIECVKGAYCDSTINLCTCEVGLEANDENTACSTNNYAGRIHFNNRDLILMTTTTIMFMFLFSARTL